MNQERRKMSQDWRQDGLGDAKDGTKIGEESARTPKFTCETGPKKERTPKFFQCFMKLWVVGSKMRQERPKMSQEMRKMSQKRCQDGPR